MNSKKALKNIRDYHNETVYDTDSIYTENIFEKELDAIEKDLSRLEKLEKVIEDIKQLPKCEVCEDNWIKGCMCFRKKLKEVLENDK